MGEIMNTVVHVALFKWKEGTSRDDVEQALQLVRSVADRVEGVREIYCGKNTSRWGKDFTDAVVVIADSSEALEAYRVDPVHKQAAEAIDVIELDGIGIDFTDP